MVAFAKINTSCVKGALVSLAMLAAALAPAFFGGFGVSVSLPDPADERTKGAVLIVQPIGCHGPGASVTARAEGLENGKRRAIPLKLIPLRGRSGTQAGDAFAVKREWPNSGSWVLVFTAHRDALHADSIVKLDGRGQVRVIDNPHYSNWDRAKVLPDKKTKMLPWTFTGDAKVPAMYIIQGDLKTAINYTLRSSG